MDLPRRGAPPAGLCESCANVRVVESGKGSRFYLCRLSAVDPAFPKYPGLPVLRCRGYAPAGISPPENRGDGA
ncbi:MAG TPA: hypothetical protein VFH27_13690 [Longimicrobiaceae bacterium]|nr:hypothetical protein [Longimicrobiaceae bacterium]